MRVNFAAEKAGDLVWKTAQNRDDDKAHDHRHNVAEIIAPRFGEHSGACKGFSLDYADFVGMPVANLTKETRARLRATVPEFVEATNPVDVTAQAIFDSSLYTKSINALMLDDRVGGVVAPIISGTPEVGLMRSGFIADGKVDNGKPLLCAFMGGDQAIDPQLKPKLALKGIPLRQLFAPWLIAPCPYTRARRC